MQVLVTGASGGLAQFVVEAMRERHDLVLTSRSKPPEDRSDLPWIQGNITDFDDCRRMVRDVEAVLHLAAIPYPTDHPGLRDGLDDPDAPPFDLTWRTNLTGTYYLLRACVEADVGTVVMTGSNSAFGHGTRLSDRPFPIHYLPIDEEHPTDIESSYAYTKWAAGELLAWFTRAHEMRTYLVHPAAIRPPYCLGQIAACMQRMAETAELVEEWDNWLWAYVASEDLADLQRMILEKAASLPLHRIYLASAADTTAIEPSCELVARFRPDLLPDTSLRGHQAFWSTARAQEEVGWVPHRTWRDFVE